MKVHLLMLNIPVGTTYIIAINFSSIFYTYKLPISEWKATHADY